MTKTVGTWLLQQGCAEDWMPSVAGLLFLIPLGIGVAMLTKIPSPNPRDIAARTARYTLSRPERWALFGRYAVGLSSLVVMYLLITVLRSLRADFAPELWRGLGVPSALGIFTRSESVIAIAVLIVNGCAVYLRENRFAFFASLATCGLGFMVIVAALVGHQIAAIDGFQFMVLVGLGLYLPYVAMHTTVFERLLAMTRERGNLGFLLYVADAFGYLGYVAVMFARSLWSAGDDFLQFFIWLCWLATGLSLVCLLLSWRYFAGRILDATGTPAAEGAT